MNHGCYSNAGISYIGDMIIVRAARNIAKDSEIFFWYTHPEAGRTWEKAQEKLLSWGFQCGCVICQQNKTMKKNVHTMRTKLSQDLSVVFGADDGNDVLKAERLLATFEKTHSTPELLSDCWKNTTTPDNPSASSPTTSAINSPATVISNSPKTLKAEYGDYLAYTCAALRNESISDLVWNIDKCDWQEVAIADIKLMLHFQTTFDRFHEFRDMLCCSADFWHHLS